MVSHTSESTTGGLASLPCNINTSSSATLDSFVSNELGGDIQDSDLPDSRTPVPSLNLLSNASSSSALNSPPKERKRFTFSFLGDKNKDKDKEKGGPLLGSSPSGSSSSQKSDQQQVTKSDSNELGKNSSKN